MTDTEPDPARTPRPWLPWTIAGAAAVAVVIAAAFVVAPRLLAAPASPSAAPSTPPAPIPTASPTPSCSVTVVDATWRDGYELDLPIDGRVTETTLGEARGAHASPFEIDDTHTGVLVQGEYGAGPSTLLVVDHDAATVVWSAEVPYGTSAVATPANAGLDDRIVVSHGVEPSYTESVLTMYDLTSGAVVAERTLAGDWAGGIHAGAGVTGYGLIAPADADGFAVTTRETATYLDAETLEPRWAVTGEQFGVGQFEGGVPFRVAGDVLFVGGHAVSIDTGEALGWSVDGSPLVAAGRVMATPIVYDSLDPYPLSGIDIRTGEACWSHQVISAASDDETLWVVTADGVLQRIDPEAGSVVEDRGQVGDMSVRLVADALVLSPRTYDADPADATVQPASGGSWTLAEYASQPLQSSNGQILVTDWGTVSTAGITTAYDAATGEVAWSLETSPVDRSSGIGVGGGVMLRTTDLGDGRMRLDLLH
ncbi:PQQ-binding-like beta-propeller repeat protein [Microbacterium telephonicum]|uniref:Outer membrane protein assembly factor BamB n=1 Tax=Microbacterium telephonicum TaxID=1714841 RepID=A0A498BWQ3_9MICO|nr:PQQ-binding-like beta-propeller repeat protein [Microbacterium telephonicum]RLK48084.1 outer membrane protein assembly factor BamB [Microbacterium telephonicum]